MKRLYATLLVTLSLINFATGQNAITESSIKLKFQDVENIMTNQPGIAHKILDSLENMMTHGNVLSTKSKVKYFLLRANTYKLENNFTQALEQVNKLDNYKMDDADLIHFNATKSSILSYLGKYDESERLVDKTIKLVNNRRVTDYKTLGLLYFTKGYVAVKTNKPSAIENLLKAEQFLAKSSSNDGLGSVFNFLAILYKNVSNYEKSLEYCLKAESVMPKDHINFGAIMNVKGQNYQYLGKNQEAEGTFRAIMNNENYSDRIKLFGGNSFSILLKEQERYQEAVEILNKILPISRKLNLKRKEAEILANLGSIQFDMKNYTEALKYYAEAKALYFDDSNQVDFENKISLQEMYVKSKLIGADGFEDLDYYITLRDSFDLLKIKENTNENLAKYESEKKERLLQTERNKVLAQENEILALNVRNFNLKSVELQNQFDLLRLKSNADSLNNMVNISQAKNLNLEKLQSIQRNSLALKNKYLTYGGVALVGVSLLAFSMLLLFRSRLKLARSLKDKNSKIILLHQELNHRVKNNLAFMTSLLEMQSRRSDSHETKAALLESESRLKALALVHSQLFKNESDNEVNLKTYLHEVTSHLKGIFITKENPIRFVTEFVDYQINAEDAMRLGLIVNELVTNSVKHAFYEQEKPKIKITTEINADGKLRLEYADNGPQYIESIEKNLTTESLGLKLVSLLKKQLGDRYILIM